jgi:[ribosomal protein S18]-alanine N-acetyltransferase
VSRAPQSPEAGAAAVVEAGACDLALLAELNRRCFLEPDGTGVAGTPWTARDMAEILALPGAFAVLAVVEGEPVGFLLGRSVLEDCEILSLGVLADSRRSGHGRRLLRAAGEAALRRGARRLILEVSQRNAGAQAFYRAEGFATLAHRKNYYLFPDGSSADAVVCARDLRLPPAPTE